MGEESLTAKQVSLVIFTCENREHLLYQTVQSFLEQCNYKFEKIIVAADGPVSGEILSFINPDIVIQHYHRSGYVNSIAKSLKTITTPYFFWLEDDWAFKTQVDISYMLQQLQQHTNRAQIVLSKYGPLIDEFKKQPIEGDLYEPVWGFSANPCLCNTKIIRDAFGLLATAPKGDVLGEDGFENFLTKTFAEQGVQCLVIDPRDHTAISHEGYLESTPRNWHMTNSIDAKTNTHLLTIPAPSAGRKLLMMIKLFITFCSLAVKQLASNKIYELCFRIIASAKTVNNND